MTVSVGTRSELGELSGLRDPARSSTDLADRLVDVRRSVAAGESGAMWILPEDSPVAAVVTAAVEAGSTVIVLADEVGGDPQLRREARRAADVTEALMAERSGTRSGR